MERREALFNAIDIAHFLLRGAIEIGRQSLIQQNLMSTLSIMTAAGKRDINSLDPTFQEIIIFGSVARGEEEVGDLDLMVFDKGFYSNIFLFERKDRKHTRADRYSTLRHNLEILFEDFLGYCAEDPMVSPLLDEFETDVHILPISIFTNKKRMEEIAGQHKDPRFFQNAFSKMLRFNGRKDQFEDIDLSYFEKKYQADPRHFQVTA